MTAKDSVKTRDELLAELQQLRRQVAELHAPAGDDRRRAAPSDHEGLLQTIVANVPIIVFAVDRAGIITFSEGQGLERLGRKPGGLVGQAVLDVYRDVPGVEEELFRALGGEPGTVRLKVDGLVLEAWYTSLRDQGGEVVGVAGMAIDVTGHERAENRLRGGQRLMGQMLQSHERDRRLIAYEIHDGLVQDATAAQMELESVLARPQLPSAVREEVQLAAELVGKSVAQARELISGLRPPILDELGVVAAIEYLIESRQGERPSVKLTTQVQFDRLEPLLEATVYRIVREAVTNQKRHSQSDRSVIRLTQVGDRLQIEIEDWGIGFDPAGVGKDRFGLQGIRERARLLGGRAVISSAPGKGTRVFVDLPVVPALQEVAIANRGSME
jgi:signal transduction histidine kinase